MDRLFAAIQASEPTYEENQYWSYDSEITNKSGELLDIRATFWDNGPLPEIASYFRTVFDVEQTEAQVVVIENEYASSFSDIPQLPYAGEYTLLVPPQKNTWGTTTVDDTFWQKRFAHVPIVFRVHSHHTLNAYQSATDYASLNSGTLEVVLGKIYNEQPEIAYWLDERGKDTKKHVFIDNDRQSRPS